MDNKVMVIYTERAVRIEFEMGTVVTLSIGSASALLTRLATAVYRLREFCDKYPCGGEQ